MNVVRVGVRGLVAATVVVLLSTGAPIAAAGTPSAENESFEVTASSPYAAQMAAFSTGRAVEDMSQRTEYVSVFALPDGTWRTTEASGPVRVLAEGDGTRPSDWAEIDLTLVRRADGSIAPRSYPRDMWLSGGGATYTVLSTELEGTDVVLSVMWDGSPLPRPILDGARATYRNVAPGVDFVVDVRPTGFEQYYVLKTPAAFRANQDLSLELVATNGSIAQLESGVVVVRDAAGADVAVMPSAFAWDAKNDRRHPNAVLQEWQAEPRLAPAELPYPYFNLDPEAIATVNADNAGRVLPELEELAIEVSSDGVSTTVDLVVDEAWATDPATEYPIIVDPSVANLTTSFDTYVRSNAANTTYHTDPELLMGTWDSGTSVYRAYINFSTSSLQGKYIIEGYLVIFENHSGNCTQTEWRAYDSVTANSSTTWNNKPTASGSPQQSTQTTGNGPGCPDNWVTMPMTNIMNVWAADTTTTSQAIRLTAKSETNNAYWKRFLSRDTSTNNKPYLNYAYDTVPNVPTNLTLGGVDGGATDTAPATGSYFTPVLSAKVTDADDGVVSAKFSVWEGSTQIVDKQLGSRSRSGSWSTLELDFALTPGATYKVEVWAWDEYSMSATSAVGWWAVDEAGALTEIPGDCDTEFDATATTSCHGGSA